MRVISETLTLVLGAMIFSLPLRAEERTIDISGNNTSSSYVTYTQSISLPAADVVNVKMARYCYFNSTITGKGRLNLYAGGERCYLGAEGGKSWANWSGYSGDVHVYRFKENSTSAASFNVVLAHGGKAFSPENVEDAVKNGRLNNAMQNNCVTLHAGAVICTEANSSNAGGFRIGELQTEEGSTLQGYMKKSRASYYLLGNLNTDATLAGTIAPTDYRDDTVLGIIKEGSGTYRITGNNNYISGALRILDGRLLVCNDRAEAETKKMRGATGAKASANEATVYVFEKGLLGGTGSIGGTVDNYGTIEPGDDAIGTLTIQNYQTPAKQPNLTVHPASVLRFKLGTDGNSDQLAVGGTVSYSNMLQDFNEGDAMPVIEIVPDGSPLELGATFLLLTAKSKTGDWNFDLKQPGQYTWEIDEQIADDGTYNVVLRLVSFDDPDNPDNPDDPDTPVSTMGPFYDDGIDDATDNTTLRAYAEKSGKKIGTAISTWKNDVGNENLSETKEIAAQFSMLAPENEMKMDALQPSQGQFTYGSADKLVSFAQRHDITVRGHCLVWHQQQPEWVSSDGKKNDKGWSRTEALAIMKDHITKVMKHFKGKVVEWDVVNECLDDDQSIIRSQPDGYTLRPTVWQRAIGDDYIDSAFVYARRADPDAVLYLNDYDVEHQGKAKATAFYNLAMRLKKKNIPVDGVGLQCHFSVGSIDSLKLERTIQRFAEADMLCIITELDVGIASTSTANLEEQARNYRVITDIVLNNQNCPHLVIWGLKDNDSWRSGSSPLLYTSGLAKKPAYYAVRSALRHRELHPSDVTAIRTIEQHSDDAIFDLGGRRIAAGSSLRPGIYIQNGRKIIFR